jgi:hypothetical protein
MSIHWLQVNLSKKNQKAEYLQLVGMVRNSYAILIGKSDEDKNRVWQDIFNKCMDLNHTWAQVSISENLKW